MKAWNETKRQTIEALRIAYLAEVARFAESLRKRFEVGELRACTDEDFDRPRKRQPMYELERLVTTHFGLKITKFRARAGRLTLRGDDVAAHLILAASPSSDAVKNGSDNVYLWATDAATWDVIRIARQRRWYRPMPGECGDPLEKGSGVAA